MELSEKIQKLRKERGLTQEEFAELLFVSRTAVSKWETGRGIPSMDSLRMIAKFYNITLDELLSAQDILVAAKEENRENINRFAYLVDGVFNVSSVLGIVLPLYKIKYESVFYSVPLYRYSGWLAVFYWIFVLSAAVCGVLQIAVKQIKTKKRIGTIGIVINVIAVFLFVLSGQPYPAVMFFVLLLIKSAVILLKIRRVSSV